MPREEELARPSCSHLTMRKLDEKDGNSLNSLTVDPVL